LQYVKGFHRLPREAPDADVLDMVDEFAARPLLNLFFAELSGVIDPLGTHHAIRRRAGLTLPAFSGPAAPAGLLIDVAHRFSLSAIGQVALEERIARPPSMDEARRRAFSVTQVVTRRAGLSENVLTGSKATPSIKLIHQADERLQIAEVEAHESELPA